MGGEDFAVGAIRAGAVRTVDDPGSGDRETTTDTATLDRAKPLMDRSYDGA
ncbi:hypothetical protein VQ042_23530 [Aurantimonas sp. A2-1-M11]|uniref:hypothetical protein n=1 Tax=Aurantimonas sp. A2-1-M11 TaxID=3113712 RepID=UPI002F936925